jgi:rhodanese-related sulfurtransferase
VNTSVAVSSRFQPYVALAGMLLMLFLIQSMHSRSLADGFSIRTVTAVEAKRLIDQGAVVVDVRGPEFFRARHIPGAVSVPLASLRQAVPKSLADAIAKPVVVYCGDGATVGPEGTELLNKAGFAKAVNLERGIDGWADAGLPLARSGT